MIRQFLVRSGNMLNNTIVNSYPKIDKIIDLDSLPSTIQANRVIACLDVRSNDDGDLVVTKGDQYDVRERNHNDSEGNIGGR